MLTFTNRLLIPILLLATVGHWHTHGLDSFPQWMGNLARRGGIEELSVARIAMGVMAAAAFTLLLCGTKRRPGLAQAVAVIYAFGCVATIASLMAQPASQGSGLAPVALTALGLGISLAAYTLVAKSPRQEHAPSRFGGFWIGTAVAAIWVGSIAVSARLDLAPRSATLAPQAGTDSIVLDHIQWQGRTIPDTGLSRLVPMLTPNTLEGRSIVILYNRECSHCREVFEQYLSNPIPDTRVIAIEIPPNPGSVPLSGDDLGEMPCGGCERMTLPQGKSYIIKPPTVLVVLEGRVICTTDTDFKACLENLPPLPPPASTQIAPPVP